MTAERQRYDRHVRGGWCLVSVVTTWGFLTEADIERGADGLSLLSETALTTLSDTVVSIRPMARSP